MSDWFEDDAFWDAVSPLIFGHPGQDADAEIKAVLELAQVPRESVVLDLGCGIGRHVAALAKLGHHVTGVDRTAAFLKRARETVGDEVELVHQDMREFRRARAFDLAINLFTTFGYFDDPADDARVAKNLYESLRPGGVLIMEMMGREVLARIFRPRDWRTVDGAYLLEERTLQRNWSWNHVQWTLIEGGEARTFEFGHRIYAGSELLALLEGAGFTEVEALGGFDGRPYNHEAQRLVVRARRPEEASAR